MDAQNTPYTLFNYLNYIKNTINQHAPGNVWVQAELRSINEKSGHRYLELAQKQDERVIASCKATIWKSKSHIVDNFVVQANTPLKAGITLLIKGTARLHPQYGFSFDIMDIDPLYTMGELSRAYAQMKQKLTENGLIHLNKTQPTPFDIRRVAVVAPQNAAGLGDFRIEADRLQKYGVCQFSYHYATFQGNDAPKSLAFALYECQKCNPDIVVIIRGGGAIGDLSYLNDYNLAAIVAEMDVPVWVGIGHYNITMY